jgi:hypothetical protein
MEHKRDRRVSAGDKVPLVFEDRETVGYQVPQMARIESIRDPAGSQHEFEVYSELVPGAARISVTLFIEIPHLSLVNSELDHLPGIDQLIAVVIGGRGDGLRWELFAA